MTPPTPLRIDIPGHSPVSGLLTRPRAAAAGYVFAHGAGAGMTHPFMATVAEGLGARGIATLRYQFPYMEHGSKRPDRPALAQAAVRAAVAAAETALPGLTLIAGGKSFGGRMTSQAQAADPLPHVGGLCFFGFPLHPAGKPASERGAHLASVTVPTLFLQGTRDALAELTLLEPLVASLGAHAELHREQDADHAFHVRKKSGRTDAQVMASMLDIAASWMMRIARR